jgi:HAD superfamily hydrolase (TIGR01509 family)
MKGFLFDLDGTLIDSMPLHAKAWQRWRAQQGLAAHDAHHFAATAGRSNAEILADLYPERSLEERRAMADAKEALYRELARAELEAISGAQAFMGSAAALGLSLAVCTAAPRENIAVAFERFAWAAEVATVTSPADGLRGKPHPDIFEEAARRMGLAASQCLVFEDAPLGVEAARRAGMKAVVLTTTLPASAFAAFDNIVATAADFASLDPRALAAAARA